MSDGMTDVWYRARIAAVPLFVAGYFVIAGLAPILNAGSGEEKYLFYHWFVFTYVPQREQVTYEAYVTNIKGENLPEPVLIEDADVLYLDDWRNRPEYASRIRLLGRLIAENGEAGAAQMRADLEHYFKVRPLSYEIRKIRYNPIDRQHSGAILSTETIARYDVK